MGEQGVRVARVYDVVDGRGPRLTVDHPLLEEGEAARVLSYLDGGRALLTGLIRMRDVMTGDGSEVVPGGFATDGTWVWCEATAYYLRTYRLAPDPELLAHIRAAGYRPPEVGDPALRRALTALRTA
ncbi:hypothetical protein GCM10023322_08470 [Rugosimonospora acidiphila]|uniref:Uncharacterized protein n=1 Tax=Rugosimonospora acidiphila TaxID=556531 RepID=A0ABP9RJX5_9ACTN